MPEDRIQRPSSLYSLGFRPLVMTGVLRRLIIQHFSDADNVEEPFKTRLFTDDNQTGILVEDATVWRPLATEKRPAVIIKRNKWVPSKRGISSGMSGTTKEGYRRFTRFWQGSHTLFAIAKEGAEADLLATEVYRTLMRFGPVHLYYLDLKLWEVAEVGDVAVVEECKDRYMVPVTLTYAWADSWVLTAQQSELAAQALPKLLKTDPPDFYLNI